MAVTYFIGLKEKENYDFDIEKFNRDIKQRFPNVIISENNEYNYNISWEDDEDEYQFNLSMERNRCAFSIDYFNSANRIYDYAKFILWLRSYFPVGKEVILCDESYNRSLVLGQGISVDKIVGLLE
jgi:hypothetical protein